MRPNRAIKHGRWVPILAAAGVGFLLGSWRANAVRGNEPITPAQTIAQRFPKDFELAAARLPTAGEHVVGVTETVADDQRLALFNPEPAVPHTAPPQPAVQLAKVEVKDLPATGPVMPAPQSSRMPEPPASEAAHEAARRRPEAVAKPRIAAIHRRVEHRGLVLDDAQIASIKQRLHMTPEQDRMWPAVAVALRKIAIAGEREARRDGQTAAVDPNGAEIQDLKYAAIPLLMSFDDEQKDEVRNLAHAMGLDRTRISILNGRRLVAPSRRRQGLSRRFDGPCDDGRNSSTAHFTPINASRAKQTRSPTSSLLATSKL